MTRLRERKWLVGALLAAGLLIGGAFASRADAAATGLYCGSRDVDCGCFSAGYCTGNWPSGEDCDGAGTECNSPE